MKLFHEEKKHLMDEKLVEVKDNVATGRLTDEECRKNERERDRGKTEVS